MRVDLAGIGGSALTDPRIAVPEAPTAGIPVTYVPARNTMMLALALGWAEVLQARDIFIGVNVLDSSGYPDCRPEFIARSKRSRLWPPERVLRARPRACMRRSFAGLRRRSSARACVWESTTRRPFPATRLTPKAARAGAAIPAACGAPVLRKLAWRIRRAIKAPAASLGCPRPSQCASRGAMTKDRPAPPRARSRPPPGVGAPQRHRGSSRSKARRESPR